jgi:hypothetical protein
MTPDLPPLLPFRLSPFPPFSLSPFPPFCLSPFPPALSPPPVPLTPGSALYYFTPRYQTDSLSDPAWRESAHTHQVRPR